MYNVPVVRLSVVRERSVAAEERMIRGPADAAQIGRALIGDADRETVLAVLLDTRHRVIAVHTVAVGSLSECRVHPRETFKAAILCNAAAVVIAHNHPSGDLRCSHADVKLTERLRRAADLLGIEMLDHVIVTEDNFVSLRQCGPYRVGSGGHDRPRPFEDRREHGL
jgi:DNA repair protein RadC